MTEEGAPFSQVLAQWHRERPDLDARCMVVCGAIWRAGQRLSAGLQQNLDRFGLDFPAMDVLLTLRRNGPDDPMRPSDLAADMMLSTAAMTARLDKLEKRALIERKPDAKDRRATRIALTAEGLILADQVVVPHVQAEQKMLSALTEAEQRQLISLLARVAPVTD